MKFWRLTYPPGRNDYSFSFINGSLTHPDGMPGVKCDLCGQTWGGSRILSCEAPPAVQARRRLGPWPLPLEQFDALRAEAEAQIGSPSLRLRPGDKFQPAILEVPSTPRADFLWASLGSLVVSRRVRDVLLSICRDVVSISEVRLGKIGKREARLPAPIPSSGEPEDLIREAVALSDTSSVGPYFEVIPMCESDWPPGGAPVSICEGCTRPSIDNDARRLVMTHEIWRGHPIFYLATTLWIIVPDHVKEALIAARPSNVFFEEV